MAQPLGDAHRNADSDGKAGCLDTRQLALCAAQRSANDLQVRRSLRRRVSIASYDRIYRDDILWEAWERARANRGAAGVDQITIAAVELMGSSRCSVNFMTASVQATTIRRRCGGWRSQSPTARSASWRPSSHGSTSSFGAGATTFAPGSGPEVPPSRPLRGVAAPSLARQEAGPIPPRRSGGPLDRSLVPRPGPAQAHWHDPLPQGCVPMSRRPSESRMRENRMHGLKGGWGTGLHSESTPLTTNAFGPRPQSHESRSSGTARRFGRSARLALLWDACHRADHDRQKERPAAHDHADLALPRGFDHRGRGLPRR